MERNRKCVGDETNFFFFLLLNELMKKTIKIYLFIYCIMYITFLIFKLLIFFSPLENLITYGEIIQTIQLNH